MPKQPIEYKTSRGDAFQKPKTSMSLYITIFLLGAGFLILIALVFAFSSSGGSGRPFFFGGGKCIAVMTIDHELTGAGSKPSVFGEGTPG